MNDRRTSDDLWRAGLTSSPLFRRWAELYPSVESRIEEILQRASPGITAVAGKLLERAGDRSRAAGQPAALQRRFGLTEAEAALASALVEGEQLSAYAKRRGVKVQTARNQLQSIFQKTGVNRQSDLLRLLLTARPPRPPE